MIRSIITTTLLAFSVICGGAYSAALKPAILATITPEEGLIVNFS